MSIDATPTSGKKLRGKPITKETAKQYQLSAARAKALRKEARMKMLAALTTELDLGEELKKFMEESFTEFVKNGVTDASWDEFQKTAKAIGVERYIELYQNAYDAFLAK